MDHVKKRDTLSTDVGVSTDLTPEPPSATPESTAEPAQDSIVSETADQNPNPEDEPVHTDPLADSQDDPENETVDSTEPRRSTRVRNPPDYFSQ